MDRAITRATLKRRRGEHEYSDSMDVDNSGISNTDTIEEEIHEEK